MRWFKPNLRSSLYAIFASSPPPPSSEDDHAPVIGIEDIRASMLGMLEGASGDRVTTVTRRIRYAVDVQGLWFLRGDLMAVLAGTHGEMATLEMLETLSDMFHGMLPQGLRSRPSPLSATPRE